MKPLRRRSLARAVKMSDLEDRLRHPGSRTGGPRPPYERALALIRTADETQRLPAPGGAESPAA